MLKALISRSALCKLAAVPFAVAWLAAPALAGFPQLPPAFPPPTGVEPLPPIIIPDPPPPVICPPEVIPVICPPVDTPETPEPATLGMALIGAGVVAVIRRRRKAN